MFGCVGFEGYPGHGSCKPGTRHVASVVKGAQEMEGKSSRDLNEIPGKHKGGKSMVGTKKAFSVTALFLFNFCVFIAGVHAGAYYVSGASGNDSNPGTLEKPWKTIHKANVTLQPGDTVYIRGGTYEVGRTISGGGSTARQGIRPSNSGTSWDARITYSAYPGEFVNFVGDSDTNVHGILLDRKSYIHVTGYNPSNPGSQNMKFSGFHLFLYIYDFDRENGTGSHYNEVDHCEFTAQGAYAYRMLSVWRFSTYNYIHNCKIHNLGYYSPTHDAGVGFEIGSETDYDTTRYNVFENNEVYHCGHHSLGIFGNHNVVRNNNLHNDRWYYYEPNNRSYGYRVLY